MSRRGPRFTEDELRQAIGSSRSWAATLRKLNYKSAGGNWKTLKKYAALWDIPADHFDPAAAQAEGLRAANRPTPLEEAMVENSTYGRQHLKRRLLQEGLKQRRCELCGQGELWRGRQMALILDHVNGVPNDHRLENLRILCPNCAATLETHCARKNRISRPVRACLHCDRPFVPNRRTQRYCSRSCGSRWNRDGHQGQQRTRGVPRPQSRKAKRPPYERLLREIEEMGYLAVGRKYRVSDNAVRKWVRFYERELAIAEGRDPEAIEIPRRTWPNRRREPAAVAD